MNHYRIPAQDAPYNQHGLRSELLPKRVQFADCTLRDGEQQPGLVFSLATKVKIARLLVDLGVDEIEAGTPMVSEEDREAVAAIVAQCPEVKVSALARARPEDIEQVADIGAWGVRISLPAGRRQLLSKIRLSHAEYLDLAQRMAHHAKAKGLAVIFSPFDTTRADEEFLREVVRTLSSEGTVDRFRLVDTTGVATPAAIGYLTRLMREESTRAPIEVHVHDDFGLATANTLAAVEAGAEVVSTTVNGIGERSGNAATEEVAAALQILYGVQTGIRLELLTDVCRSIAWLTRTEIAKSKSVIGDNAFAHESGLVVGGLLKDPATAEPYPPEVVGQKRRIVIGKKSGTASVEERLRGAGRDGCDADRVRRILNRVKERSLLLERALTTSEVDTIIETEADSFGGRP